MIALQTRNKPSRKRLAVSPTLDRELAQRRAARLALVARAQRIAKQKIDFIPNPGFSRSVAPPVDLQRLAAEPRGARSASRSGGQLGAYIGCLYETSLLSPEDEAACFRRLNYLRYRAAKLRKSLDASRPKRVLVEEIEAALSEADSIRAHLIRANLRLVVAIAKKFADAHLALDDLISEGNVALIHAVEKFNYARGFRFSTYATYAVQRKLYQTVTQQQKRRARYVTRDQSTLEISSEERGLEPNPWSAAIPWENALHALVARLSERERAIIARRYGLDEQPPQTLREIAAHMGVCKERVRQLEVRALRALQDWAAESKIPLHELVPVGD